MRRFLKTLDLPWRNDAPDSKHAAGAMSKMDRPSPMKTTKITVETETLVIVRHAKATRRWCRDCRAEVNVITLDDNTLVDLTATAPIQEWLTAGKLHFRQPATGSVQIWLKSLLGCFESAEAQRVCRCIANQFDEVRRKQ